MNSFQQIWVINYYYDMYKLIPIKLPNKRMALPKKSFPNAIIEMVGLAPGAFDDLSEAELNLQIIENWMLTGELCNALFQIAQRSRLNILLPTVFEDQPFVIKSAAEFLNKNSKIQQWISIHKESNKKWGLAHSLSELMVMYKKTCEDRKKCTIFQKNLLKNCPRPFKLSILLPDKIIDCFNSDITIKSEVKLSINQASMYLGKSSENLIRSAFPGLYVSTLKSSISEVARDISLLEDEKIREEEDLLLCSDEVLATKLH